MDCGFKEHSNEFQCSFSFVINFVALNSQCMWLWWGNRSELCACWCNCMIYAQNYLSSQQAAALPPAVFCVSGNYPAVLQSANLSPVTLITAEPAEKCICKSLLHNLETFQLYLSRSFLKVENQYTVKIFWVKKVEALRQPIWTIEMFSVYIGY